MSSVDDVGGMVEEPQDIGKDPRAIARRWKTELSLANKREKTWRETAKRIYKMYMPEESVANTFNILWPNTETLRQALYNSIPEPQCKRRYADEDPIGFKVGEVLTRSLEFSIDSSDFDRVCQATVLSMLLPGRAVVWERYVPDIRSDEPNDEGQGYEEVEWEQVVSEKVQYDDFRILCAAKTWDDVTAIARRHTLNRRSLIEKFGEKIGKAVKLDSIDLDNSDNPEDADLFKTAEVWEIWCKESKHVYFINDSYPTCLKIEEDPLGLSGFFPTPRPLYAIENDNTLIPACLYTQYEPQAKELNRISVRINKLVDALKLRGIYDATLGELNGLMSAADNELIPSMGVTELIDRGGLEKAIWMMPIDTAASVLKELYIQRDAIKSVIYEITGISDIMRSASDPRETFGAQKIKTQWGTQRLQRMQREVQRYIRDMLRIKAEIISKKFQMETLERMTMVKMPHQMEVDQQMQAMMVQYQQMAQQAQMQGQQPPPPPQLPPPPITWEAVMQEIQDDLSRTYHIDIETDSTLASAQDSDMEGLKTTLTGIVELMNGFGPAVQSGAVPIDVVKSLVGVVVRRAKMGSAVEEAIEKIIQPQPQEDPEKRKVDADMQKHQQQMQHEQQIQQMKMQQEAQLAQLKAEGDMAKEQAQAQGDAAREQYRAQADAEIAKNKVQMDLATEEAKLRMNFEVDEAERNHKIQLLQLEKQSSDALALKQLEFEQWKTEFEAATKIVIAQISAQSSMDQALLSAEQAANAEVAEEVGKDDKIASLTEMHGKTLSAITDVMKQLSKPKKIVRDADGKAQGIE